MFEKGADPSFVQKVAYDMSREPPQIAIASMQSLLTRDFSTLLPDIHVPVLAINSDLSPTDAARIGKYLPGFKADVLDHTGHFLMMEVPQRFNPVLLKDIALWRRRPNTDGELVRSGAVGPQRIRNQLNVREISSSSMEDQAVAIGIPAPCS